MIQKIGKTDLSVFVHQVHRLSFYFLNLFLLSRLMITIMNCFLIKNIILNVYSNHLENLIINTVFF